MPLRQSPWIPLYGQSYFQNYFAPAGEGVQHFVLGGCGGLIFDTIGNLYGTTYANDVYGRGVVFQLTPNPDGSWSENVLHQFTGGTDGGEPLASLIFDLSGNMYGTTAAGGNLSQCSGNGCGVVFKLTPSGEGRWNEQVLHRFTGGRDGSQPLAGLTVDGAANLYSTTSLGGNLSRCGCGAVFRLTPNTDDRWRESVLHSFVGHPGSLPRAGVVFDKAGNIYGTTQGNGVQTFGSVFEITP